MLVSDVVEQVRNIVQDTQEPFRYPDHVLVGFVNQTLKRMVVLRPDLFASIEEITTTPNTVFQTLPNDALRLIDIFQVKGGNAVTEINRPMLDRTTPNWATEAPSSPINFMRHIRNDTKYFLYPAPKEGVVLIGEYARVLPDYELSDEVDILPDAYLTVVVDGTVGIAESVDDEYVANSRAQMYQQMFTQALGVSTEARQITDFDSGGLGSDGVK